MTLVLIPPASIVVPISGRCASLTAVLQTRGSRELPAADPVRLGEDAEARARCSRAWNGEGSEAELAGQPPGGVLDELRRAADVDEDPAGRADDRDGRARPAAVVEHRGGDRGQAHHGLVDADRVPAPAGGARGPPR